MDLSKRQALSLDGEWKLALLFQEPVGMYSTWQELTDAGLETLPATVPGNLELDLQAAGKLPEPFYGMNMTLLEPLERAHVYYGRTFTAPVDLGEDTRILFKGLDCLADIFINGELVGSADNMLIEHEVYPLAFLRPGAENEILVHIRPALEEARRYDYSAGLHAGAASFESLYIRKAPHMYGWDIMPRALSAGLWRSVCLMRYPSEYIEQVFLETQSLAADHTSAQMMLHYQVQIEGAAGEQYELLLEGDCGASSFCQRRRILFDAGNIQFRIDHPALWWPRGRGEQALYVCKVTLLHSGAAVDTVEFTTGIRTAELERSSITDERGSGEFCFRINGEKVFVHGSNWVPVDAFHSRDAARIPQIIAMAEELNINMFRCWGGNVYENDVFYELCDQKGIMIWQDFAMACAVYPQDAGFCNKLEDEARAVVRRLRMHPALTLWAGDNECDESYSWAGRKRDPNNNVLTREVLPAVLRDEDPTRPYIPSSPHVDETAFKAGEIYLPEQHLWGPRDYFKSPYYKTSLCHFASEIGYHGCPAPISIRKFISPDKVWPYQDNEEWQLHSTSPVPGMRLFDGRVLLMEKQVRELFGAVPDNLPAYALASQISQAEAKKFFVELFRTMKWRRTGILWWNLMDGWPQFSDAIVDYYFNKKLAFSYLQRSQLPLCLVLSEPADWAQALVACNDTRDDLAVRYTVTDQASGRVVLEGTGIAYRDASTRLGIIPFSMGAKRLYVIRWESTLGAAANHYLAGNPPFELKQYVEWMTQSGLLSAEWLKQNGLGV
ncbi:MAG: glycoside hydrolase family 2 [Chloroflexi bacterium]|nr:glycoside hydrolase family 2 [Chloroflexota bacterium]